MSEKHGCNYMSRGKNNSLYKSHFYKSKTVRDKVRFLYMCKYKAVIKIHTENQA